MLVLFHRKIHLDLLFVVLHGYTVLEVLEKRKNQRFDMNLPLELVCGTSEAPILEPARQGETRNVSSAGVFFRIAERMRIGQPIEYFLTFPKAPGSQTSVRVRCLGTVVREVREESSFAATLERYEFVR